MPDDLIQASIQSPNQKHRYRISVSDEGNLVATKLVLKDGAWTEPRPEVARKNLAVRRLTALKT
jgi:hypothetical protein